MRKKRTSRPVRGIKQGIALFLGVVALWLVWLTGDPVSAAAYIRRLADNALVSTTLLSAELGMPPAEDALSRWDRLVLAQSSLLGLAPPSPSPSVEPTPPPQPEVSTQPSAPPATTTAPDDIIPRTIVAGSSNKYVHSGGLWVYNYTDYALDLDSLLANAPDLSGGGDGPQILIYHSHATEAYTMDGTDIYQESDSYRTLDTERNMVRIGAEMATIFEAAGLEVIHDTTLYDYPNYNNAYNRSSEGVAAILAEHPSVRLVLDVHRDALAASDGTVYKTVAGTVDNCAQIMLVMGSDAAGQAHPNWRVNLALALEIQSALAQRWSTLARPLALRASRFNQHQSTGSVLVEVGAHGNTLQEAITAARLFARAVADLMTQ